MARLTDSGRTAGRPVRVCLVATEIAGDRTITEKSAFIASIVQSFAAAGSDVTLLWVPPSESKIEEKTVDQLRRYFSEKSRINLVTLPPSKQLLSGRSTIAKQSVAVYHYVQEQNFDSVFFSLEGGLGYFSLLAKETGVFETPPQLYVIAQTTTDWTSEADKFFLENIEQVTAAYMERYCAEECDGLICASQALLAWMKRKHWKLSRQTTVIMPAIPHELRLTGQTSTGTIRKLNEIVFLAGTEYHKGFTLLCDALDRAASKLPANLTVTVMGPFGRILGEHTGGMLVRRGRNWPFELKLLPHASPQDRLSYVRDRGALAVFPSYDSCTNLWMSACIAAGLPFIGTNVGANPELLTARSRADCLCDPTAALLAQKIIDTVTEGSTIAAPSKQLEQTHGAWSKLLASTVRRRGRAKRPRNVARAPLVTVVLVHHDRPHYLLQAVKSVEQQDYPKLELIVVDDGSKQPETRMVLNSLEPRFRKRRWRILREKNKYLGAARNTGARAARGTHILFLDDDNALFPSCVSTLVHAMNSSGADICTSFHRTFYGNSVPAREDAGFIQYITLGGSLDIGIIENTFGDANAMVRREVFKKIGYQVELFGRTGEDWEFFARAVLAGLKLRVVPKPIYWYRSSTTGMFRTSHWFDNRLPTLETFRKYGFKGLDHLYHLALSAHIDRWDKQSLRGNLSFSPSDERFLELCELDPESDEALDMLASIAAAEGRPGTALILLGQRRRSGSFSKEAAERLDAKTETQTALTELHAGLLEETDLSYEELRMFATPMLQPEETLPLLYVENDPARLYVQAREQMSTATLSAGCPMSTIGVSLTVSLEQAIAQPTEFKAMIAPAHLAPALAITQSDHDSVGASSDWHLLSQPKQSTRIDVRLPAPSSSAMNLIVAVRPAADGRSTMTTGCFSNISIKRLISGEQTRRPRIGAPPTRLRARECTPEEFGRAQLATPYDSQLPLLLFPPEGGLFLRPSKQGPVVAMLDWSFPAFARRAIGYVEVAHEDASPFEFAMALTQPGEMANWRKDTPTNCLEFSGWTRVVSKFQLHEIVLENKHLVKTPLVLNLAIRLPRGSIPSPANTYWRKIVLAWDE